MWVGMVGEHMTFWSIFGSSGLTFLTNIDSDFCWWMVMKYDCFFLQTCLRAQLSFFLANIDSDLFALEISFQRLDSG